MKKITKNYRTSLIIGIVAMVLIVVVAAVGTVGNPALLIPFRSVLSSGKGWGYTTIVKQFLINIILGIGFRGWSSSFGKIVVAAGFWASLLLLVVSLIHVCKKDEKKKVAPIVLIFLLIVGLLGIIEACLYGTEVGALGRRANMGIMIMIVLGIIALIALISALKASTQVAAEVAKEECPCKAKIEELQASESELKKEVEELKKQVEELKNVKVVPTPVVVEVKTEAPVVETTGSLNIQRIPFATKLAAAEKDLQDKFKELSDYIESTYKVSTRESIAGVSWSAHRQKLVFATVIGKHIRVNFALNANDYADTKLPVSNSNNKKFEELQLTLKVKSDLSLRRAKQLVDDVMASKEIEKN